MKTFYDVAEHFGYNSIEKFTDNDDKYVKVYGPKKGLWENGLAPGRAVCLMVKRTNSGIKLAVFAAQLCYLLALWPWVSCLSSLRLNFSPL